MNAQDHLKNDLLSKLLELMPNLSEDVINNVSIAYTVASENYAITEAEKSLTVIGREEFQRIVKTYIVVKKMEGLSDKTLAQYLINLNHLMMAVSKPISEITSNDIRLYLFNYQNKRGITNRSLDRIRSCICTFFRWAATEKYIPSCPSDGVHVIKFEEKPRNSLEQVDLEHLRNACTTARDAAILETLYSTGCRVSELINIKLTDINWNQNTVRLFGKGRKYRTSFLNAKALVSIQRYLNSRKHQSEYLFCNERGGGVMSKENVERMFKKLSAAAGLTKKVTPHVIRHTTATQALQSGMPINDIQQLLGHANVATTMIYAHTSIENVKDYHRRCVV